MTVKEAAVRMKKSELFVREGLKQKIFDFGYAVKVSENRWNFHISRKKFEEYMGAE